MLSSCLFFDMIEVVLKDILENLETSVFLLINLDMTFFERDSEDLLRA